MVSEKIQLGMSPKHEHKGFLLGDIADGFQRQSWVRVKGDKRPQRTRWLGRTRSGDTRSPGSTGPPRTWCWGHVAAQTSQPTLPWATGPFGMCQMNPLAKAVTEAETPDEQTAAAGKKRSGKCRTVLRQPQLRQLQPTGGDKE